MKLIFIPFRRILTGSVYNYSETFAIQKGMYLQELDYMDETDAGGVFKNMKGTRPGFALEDMPADSGDSIIVWNGLDPDAFFYAEEISLNYKKL